MVFRSFRSFRFLRQKVLRFPEYPVKGGNCIFVFQEDEGPGTPLGFKHWPWGRPELWGRPVSSCLLRVCDCRFFGKSFCQERLSSGFRARPEACMQDLLAFTLQLGQMLVCIAYMSCVDIFGPLRTEQAVCGARLPAAAAQGDPARGRCHLTSDPCSGTICPPSQAKIVVFKPTKMGDAKKNQKGTSWEVGFSTSTVFFCLNCFLAVSFLFLGISVFLLQSGLCRIVFVGTTPHFVGVRLTRFETVPRSNPGKPSPPPKKQKNNPVDSSVQFDFI